MGMNPRLLRPTASGFNPRQISGLAAWYDASDSSTLYTTDAGSVTAVSSPLDISGCALWLDGSDATTMFDATSGGSQVANGGSVARWQDKSGNGRHFIQSTASLRPTLTASARNGLSVVTFDATDDYMVSAASHNIPQPATWIFVYKTPANVASFWSLVDSGTDRIHVYSASGSDLRMFTAGGSIILEPDSLAANSWRVGTYHFNGASSQGRRDGARSATGTVGSVAVNGAIYLGSNNGGGAVLRSQIAEAILLTGVTSFADIARIEKYLAAKWGVTGVHAQATAANDPVGAWLDKSGNGRHVTQATAANRPIIASENGRAALAFDGVNDQLTHTLSSTVGANAVSLVAVARNNMTSQPTFLTTPVDLSSGNNGRPITRWEGGGGFNNRLFVGTLYVDITNIFKARSTRFVQVFTGERDALGSGTHRVREFFDGGDTAGGGITATWSTASQLVAIGARADVGTIYKGNICEVLIYDKVLSSSERRRIEAYLSAKWTTPLAPQVSNADAQNWIDRVYANAGTVSQSTAQAVNAFCNAVDAAGLREKFLRLNLFCGSNLNAALVPLYRNWRAYASRNLLSVRDDVTQSGWTKSGVTAAFSASQRPFAYGPYANIVTANAATGTTPHIASTAGNYGYGKVTVSAYLKANGQNTVRLLLVGSSGMTFPGGGTVAYVNINLANGTTSNLLAGTTVNVTSVGNGWYRLAYTCDNNWAGNMTIRFDVGDGSSYNPTGSESFFIWGIQSEVNATATDYDPYPLGNATDTNNGPFVSGDYVETGSGGGLVGNGSSKYLNTGLAMDAVGATGHVAAYLRTYVSQNAYFIGSRDARDWYAIRTWGGTAVQGYYGINDGEVLSLSSTSPAFYQITRTNAGTPSLSNAASAMYQNGTSVVTDSGVAAGILTHSNQFFVFSANLSGSPNTYSSARIGGYSIGPSMTASQAADYNTAMQAFQTALSRNV